ncbi:hypothetical protein SAY87_016149 [Trapa incisa]|uniref:CRAL-TRIO domain-containing protein n=1 Tax=Trapa incisa TaxID=236973 RepID=A0AAN7L0S9_9MYRT|nr:hypothetical protein SAY87_016149 [Trapa incisa]
MELKNEKLSVTREEEQRCGGDILIEKSKVEIMRTIVEREDPSSKDVDDHTLRRFLRAQDLDVDKASDMFLKYLNWKRTFIPNGYIAEREIRNELAQNKLFIQGYSKKGQPIIVLLGNKHKPSKSGLDEFKRCVVYAFDKICARIPSGKDNFIAIADLEGWGYKNSDVRGYIAALLILQDCYPERLGKLFFIHVPYMFMTAWKMICPFLDSRTTKKICFVENKKLRATLHSEIDEDQLPEIYGGKLPLVPVQDI